MSIFAIIPARGGSKGLPRKNLLPLDGVPLIGRAVNAACGARHVDCVLVSTDDDDIATAATAFGARVVRRPAGLAGDTASSESALLHALEDHRARTATVPDITVFIQCTSPLVTAPDIDGAIETLQRLEADSCFTATRFTHFVWAPCADGAVRGLNHSPLDRPRRQDMPLQWLENGAVYVFRTEGFLKARHRFFGKIVAAEMPAERSVEIDTLHDMALAEHVLRAPGRG